jgi:hypothetical protein
MSASSSSSSSPEQKEAQVMRRFAAVLLFAFFVATPASAAMRITFDPGGTLLEFITKYYQWKDWGMNVVIDGMCISACTLITGILENDKVCVTERARLAFHSARYSINDEHASEGTRLAWNIYPEKVRALLRAKGWDGDDPEKNKHPDLIYVEGDELRTIYRDCNA